MSAALVTSSARADRVSTPRGIQLGLVVLGVASLLMCCAVRGAVDDQRRAVKTVCVDAAPSIIAAQHVVASLADMEANLVNELLVYPSEQPSLAKAYEARLKEATESLLAAAENITYGDAERVPIRTMLLEIPHFHGLAALARLHHERSDHAATVTAYREAAVAMTGTVMPAARALEAANVKVLEGTYRERTTAASRMRALVWLTGLLLIALAVAVQLFVTRRTRRVLNAGLLAAAALTFAFVGLVLYRLDASVEALRGGREDAFASVHLLWQARALSYEGNTDESRWLLDAERRPQYARDFTERAERILKMPPGMSVPELAAASRSGSVPAEADGFIAGELRNITFGGELEAALKVLETRQVYMAADARIRELERGGDHREAVRFCISYAPGDSNWAFDQFDNALSKVIEINEKAFADFTARGFGALDGLDTLALLVGVLIPLLAFLGLRPRLREYA